MPPTATRRRAIATLAAAALAPAVFAATANADSFRWSPYKTCVVSFGSDKQVQIQWRIYLTRTGEVRTKPHRIQWKTNSPGIPLYPIDYFVIGLSPTPHSVATEDVTDGPSGSWFVDELKYTGVPLLKSPYVVIDAHLSNSTRICSVTIPF